MTALNEYGKEFADLVVGISVGSEDVYRSSRDGVVNEAGIREGPAKIAKFVRETRRTLNGTLLEDKPIGHTDTWSAWGNSSNSEVLDAVDFAATSLYPYYEDDKGNGFDNATNVFDYIYGIAQDAADEAGVPLWIAETGYPVDGPTWGDAEASVENAAAYWQTIGCTLFGRANVWWYNLGDSNPDNEASFAISEEFDTTPRFNLSCAADVGAPVAINVEEDEGTAVRINGSGLLLVVALAAVSGMVL